MKLDRLTWCLSATLPIWGVALSAAGCSTAGVIRADRPEVFGRERLLSQRLRELSFLRGKLDEKVAVRFQGLEDSRTFTGLYAGLRATYSPAATKLADAVIARTLQNVNAATARESLDQELALERRRQALDSVRAGEDGGEESLPETPSTAERPALPTLPGGYLGFGSKGDLPDLPDPGDIRKTQAELTNIEELNEQLAYRDAINARMLEQHLDDTHDLDGFTLYTLKFDVSVLPRPGEDRLGRVWLSIDDDRLAAADPELLDAKSLYELFKRWSRTLAPRMGREARDLYRLAQTAQDPLEKGALYQAFQPLLELDPNATPSFLSTSSPIMATSQSALVAASAGETSPSKKLQDAVYLAVAARYGHALERYVAVHVDTTKELPQYRVDTLSTGNMDTPTAVGLQASGDSSAELAAALARVDDQLVALRTPLGARQWVLDAVRTSAYGKYRPYIYTVTPKQHAQNVSSVAAQDTILHLMTALSAQLPNGPDAELTSDFISRSQELLHGINRFPLVSGFIEGEREFGWILGPRFKLERTWRLFRPDTMEVGFEQAPAQHSFSVSVAVPPLLSVLPLKGSFAWLDDDGDAEDPGPLFPARGSTAAITTVGLVDVKLPGPDYDALTTHLLAKAGFDVRTPQVTAASRYTLQADRQGSLLILGAELWRNPTVFVGGQAADSVEILPDMRGIRATFDKIVAPATKDPKQPVVTDLTVITSGGQRVLRDMVTILPKEPEKQTKTPEATFVRSWVVLANARVPAQAHAAIEVDVPTAAIPSETARVSIRLKKKKSTRSIELTDSARVTDLDAKTRRLWIQPGFRSADRPEFWPTEDWGPLSGGIETELEVWVTAKPGEEPKLAAKGKGSLVLFADEDAATLRLEPNVMQSSGNGWVQTALTVVVPAAQLVGHPGLGGALASGKATLGLEAPGGSSPSAIPIASHWPQRLDSGDLEIVIPAGKLPSPQIARTVRSVYLRYGKSEHESIPIEGLEVAAISSVGIGDQGTISADLSLLTDGSSVTGDEAFFREVVAGRANLKFQCLNASGTPLPLDSVSVPLGAANLTHAGGRLALYLPQALLNSAASAWATAIAGGAERFSLSIEATLRGKPKSIPLHYYVEK